MNGLETVEKISRKYNINMDNFILAGSKLMLKEKKRKFQQERFEIL